MKEFESIGKKMPYTESEDNLNSLIERATEQAIEKRRKAKAVSLWPAINRHVRLAVTSAAAILLLVAGIGYSLINTEQQLTGTMAQTEEVGPIDEFLDGISDDEAQFLAYYDLEDIPEYEP